MASQLSQPGTDVYRLSNYPDLSGRGGLIAEGRWHSRGMSVVYCSESLDVCIKEVVRHLGVPAILIPDSYIVLKVHIPAKAKIISILDEELPTDWRSDYDITQAIGDEWLRSMSSPVLKVPSAIAPSFNFVINSGHRNSDYITVSEATPINDYIYR